eukprot:80066-Hanusia_phi.AAC.1
MRRVIQIVKKRAENKKIRAEGKENNHLRTLEEAGEENGGAPQAESKRGKGGAGESIPARKEVDDVKWTLNLPDENIQRGWTRRGPGKGWRRKEGKRKWRQGDGGRGKRMRARKLDHLALGAAKSAMVAEIE